MTLQQWAEAQRAELALRVESERAAWARVDACDRRFFMAAVAAVAFLLFWPAKWMPRGGRYGQD